MFFKLIRRNSKRNRQDQSLYFSSMVISIIAFYVILSLENQDVMVFLKTMESDAVNRLMAIIPVFYLTSLVILFFLVYFAGSIQIERRQHEFGVYLSLGMKRSRLFAMLLLEDLHSNLLALLIGLPAAILLSEFVSLVTAKVIGLGIIGHRFTLSLPAVLFTIIGFLFVKLSSSAFLSLSVSRKEIGQLLAPSPSGTKKQWPKGIYFLAGVFGLLMLVKAYQYGISGEAWMSIPRMALTIFLGGTGTILLFFGLRAAIGFLVNIGPKKTLHTFNFRQVQELLIHRSTTAAICSLLIFSALCLFIVGITITANTPEDEHVLDYTFSYRDGKKNSEENLTTAQVQSYLEEAGLNSRFSSLPEVRLGYPKTLSGLSLDNLLEEIAQAGHSEKRATLINNLSQYDNCHLISLSGYNELRNLANMEAIRLSDKEACLYMDKEFLLEEELLNSILAKSPTIQLGTKPLTLRGQVESLSLVTDRAITLGLALIVPDSGFETYVGDHYAGFVSGILQEDFIKEKGLMRAIGETNDLLDETPLGYESYLQNIGRQLFYIVAASYLTLYLAIIFLLVANTGIGVQFLMGQRKTHRRYQTLVYLGAGYDVLCQSARKQISWYFGLPILVALINSFFGVQSLFSGFLPSSIEAEANSAKQRIIFTLVLAILVIIEYAYIRLVKRSSDKFLWTLMSPKREE